jgi:Asp-tRNA(Asn)/Glu-tRNA(Gln) amidotransferase C subunit
MREDNKIYENTREELMANAPDIEGEFFKVPKIN